jgi:hypothetical protein
MSQPILLDIHGAIATVTFNRPHALNAVNLSMARALRDAAEELSARMVELLIRLPLTGESRVDVGFARSQRSGPRISPAWRSGADQSSGAIARNRSGAADLALGP